MNNEALTPQETEKEKIILGITSFVQENRKDYAEEIYRLWIEPFIDASQPSLPLDWEKEFDTAFCNEIIESNGTEGGLRDNELQMFWEGAEFLRNKAKDWIKTHLLSKVSYGNGMKWRDAKIDPPKVRHNYFVKMLSYRSDAQYIFNATCLFDGKAFIDDINCNLIRHGNTVVYWLDESSATLSDEDIERMAYEFADEAVLMEGPDFTLSKSSFIAGFKAAQHLK